MSNYSMILTKVGLAKVTNAQLTNENVLITHFVVGDGNGANYVPTQEMTALKNEKWRGAVSSVEIDKDNPHWIIVTGAIPAKDGGFMIREAGLIDKDGDLVAIGNTPETYKPLQTEGAAKDLILKQYIEVSNAANVTLQIDPTVIIASRDYVDKTLGKQLQKASHLNQPLKYGPITLPSDLRHDITFDLWRDTKDGKIKHNYNIDNETASWVTYYVSQTGNDNNDGLTESTPKRSLGALVNAIENDSNVQNAQIAIVGGYLSRVYMAINRTITKNYAIVGKGTETIIGNYEAGLVWSQHETTNVYKATVSSSNVAVYDRKYQAAFDLPLKYQQVTTITDCVATPASFFNDGANVYVHRKNGESINNNELHVCINAALFTVTFGADSTFIIKDITFLNARIVDPMYFTSANENAQGCVIMQNVKLYSSYRQANGFKFYNVKSSWLFDCTAVDISQDAFNYHVAANGYTPFAFEYNCVAYNCGHDNVAGTCNATTAHDGYHILRVGSIGQLTKGPVLADVNGCYSVCIDCTMHDSVVDGDTKSAFFFNDAAWLGNANPDGKAILINCAGGDATTYSINSDDRFKREKITIEQGFKGNNFPPDITFSFI